MRAVSYASEVAGNSVLSAGELFDSGHDPIAAQTAMRAHLQASEERWIGGALQHGIAP
ncbi:GntR domain protein [Burkholderia ambifaria IOP40-10]|jgi:hypothetical protein|uniref:GntR domain protein n=1 Tax=Burkholderia ambifaria IOP40-10 TaxID=396596 RepID=B1FNH9_9BURK|nr:GntR domain protein [Burkholderia ambifaria IOP40-10]